MESQQPDLEPAKARFVSALGSKADDLHVRLQEYLDLQRSEMRDDLRRRCHALATSARLFSMHELEETSRSAVSMFDVLRAENRDPTEEEADFFETMIGRVQSLATSHQSGSYTSSAFRLASRTRKESSSKQEAEDAARAALAREIEALLREEVVDRSSLYNDRVRQRCEQMGPPHLGVLQRLRDGTPAPDLLADRAVDRVVLRETLEALRGLGALGLIAEESPQEVDELEFDIEEHLSSNRFGLPQWGVMGGVLVGLVVLLALEPDQLAKTEELSGLAEAPLALAEPLQEPPKIAQAPKEARSEPAVAKAEIIKPIEVAVEPPPQALSGKEGELLIMPGSDPNVHVRIGSDDHGSPPVQVVLPEGLHTVVFESGEETHYRFWHVRAGLRRQVSAP